MSTTVRRTIIGVASSVALFVLLGCGPTVLDRDKGQPAPTTIGWRCVTVLPDGTILRGECAPVWP